MGGSAEELGPVRGVAAALRAGDARWIPRVAEARLGYAMALAGLKRYDEARAQLTEGSDALPDPAGVRDMLARLPLGDHPK